MPNRERDDELLAAALAEGHDCPPIEALESLMDEGAPSPLRQHLDNCPRCRTELQLLRSFTSNEVAPQERAAVESIVARLRSGAPAIAPRPAVRQERQPWWKAMFATPWLTPAAATLAIALLVTGVTIQMRQASRPALDTRTGGTEVLRSSAIAILSPVGDVREKPADIRWEAVPNAAKYQVRIMEVDHAELWSAETDAPRIDLPARVENLIVPSKTLLIQIGAFDLAGRRLAESETIRFRLLQKLYTQ